MSPDSEEIQHESVDREKPLRVRSGCEPAYLSRALSRRLMRHLCAALLHEDPAGGRTSRDPPQEPHYGDAVDGSSHVQDEISRCELAGLQPGPRSTRRCDGVGVRGSDRCLDVRPEWRSIIES